MTALKRLFFLAALAMATGAFPAWSKAQQVTPGSGSESQEISPPPGFSLSCSRYAWLCKNRSMTPGGIKGDAKLAAARQVNAEVNGAIRPLTDPENYGVAEYWSLPSNGRGDCEDYALEKYRRLLDAGVDSRDLRIAVVLDSRGDNHVVLVLHHSDGDLVLDSLIQAILPWNETGYSFLAAQMGEDKSRWEVVANGSRNNRMLAAN
jgi:predicted transglutaminase-like cysteine proteinase